MKNPTTLIGLTSAILISTSAIAQDVILFKNGNEKLVKVLEVAPTEVKFKSFDNPDGPMYSESKSKIFMIKYENGAKDVFNGTSPESSAPVTPPANSKQVTNYNRTIYNEADFKNPDYIVFIDGDSIFCQIESITAAGIRYSAYRRGVDTRSAEVPMKHVMRYYKNPNPRSAASPMVSSTPISTEGILPKVPQKEEVKPVDDDEFLPEIRKYGGPRVGATYVGPGAYRDLLEYEGKRELYSQFGWQFEKRLFTTKTGISGMVEFVPAIGGLDMGKFIPSASALIGVRVKNGIEFGAGPNAAIYGYKNEKGYVTTTTNFGVVIAAGFSFKSDKVYFPVNIAFIPSVGKRVRAVDEKGQPTSKTIETGAKISLLVGFNYRKS